MNMAGWGRHPAPSDALERLFTGHSARLPFQPDDGIVVVRTQSHEGSNDDAGSTDDGRRLLQDP
jgi:hypothetical protein